MVTAYLIDSTDWEPISGAGKTISAWIDERNIGAKKSSEVRIYCSKTKPSADDFIRAKQIFRPKGNDDVMQITPETEDTIVWAKCSDGSEATVNVSNDGIAVIKKHEVAIQDQHSDIIDVYLCRELGDIILASDAVVNTRTVELVAGHGMQTGDVLCIKNGIWYQGRVTVNGNIITVNQPFNKTYPLGTQAKRTSSALNVDGSVTPVLFKAYPPLSLKWDITRMLGVIRDDAAMDDGKFGAIVNGLANGVMFRIKKTAERYNNLFNARTNGEFAIRAYDVQYTDATLGPSGQYGLRFRRSFNGFDKNGVVVRLDGMKGEELQVIVQDNLSSLTYFSIVIQGHVVED
jgi:hypothetical protein